MSLSTRFTLWAICIAVVLAILAAGGYYTLDRIEAAQALAAQDHQISSRVRRLRTLLFGFHNYSYASAITGHERDRRFRDAYLESLRVALAEPMNHPFVDPGFRQEYQRIASQARTLVDSISTGPSETVPLGASWLLNPVYRVSYLDLIGRLELLVERAIEEAAAERIRAQHVLEQQTLLMTALIAIALALLIAGIVFFELSVIQPFSRFTDLVDRLRHGDLSARWTGSQSDEIGTMGGTFNLLVERLANQETERKELVASIVHDIKNPLGAVQLNIEAALVTLDHNAPQLRRAQDNLKRLTRLIDDLSASVRGMPESGSTNIVPISLEDFLLNLIADFEQANPGRCIRFRKQSNLPRIQTDPDRLARVASNLLTNAGKYSPLDAVVDVNAGTTGDRVYIEVADRGPGIHDAEKENIFQPFSRLQSTRDAGIEGSGMGLAIVRQLVTMLRGTVSVSDRTGGGSVFRIELPVHRTVDPDSE